MFPGPSRSQVWTNLELYGGQILDIAIDPTQPMKMFVASYMGDGLFVTSDRGNTWQAVEMEHRNQGEDTFKNHAVWAVKIAQSNSRVVWAAHNYWVARSTDGGQTWAHILNSTMQRDCTGCGGEADNFRLCTALAVDPRDPQTVYVGTRGPWGTYAKGAVYRTKDGGVTWRKMKQGVDFDYSVTDIKIDPQNSTTIWATTSSFGYGGVWAGSLYRSGDGGETWGRIMGLNSGFTSVAVKPDDSNSVFTGSGWGIIKHFFDGTRWQFLWPVIPEVVGCRMAEDIVFDPQDPQVLYAAWKNTWFGDFLPKISRSVDGGTTWETYAVDNQFLTLAIDQTTPTVYGGSINLGVFRSGDHGQTWTSINNGINAVIVYDVAVDPKEPNHILAGSISGIYEKKQGAAWSRLLQYDTGSVEFDPRDSRIIYAGLWGYVAKTTDGGQRWAFTRYSDGSGQVNDIDVDPVVAGTFYIAVGSTGSAGAIYKTDDGGVSFSKVLTGQNRSGQPYGFNAVKIDPSESRHVFAGGGNFYVPRVDGDLWESRDGGTTWIRNSLSDLNITVNALLIDPRNPKTIYAGCGFSADASVPIYKSTDGGNIWESSFNGIPSERKILHGVWGDSSSDIFIVGWSGIIFRYDGNNWVEMMSGTTENLEAIWGSSSASVFAVGARGTILHYDGNNWVSMNSGTTEYLQGIWGSSSASVFGVGASGTILHYDGNGWTPMASGTTAELWGVWGSASANVYAVGADGTILHYDGNGWTPMVSGTTMGLNSVWGDSPTDVYAVGEMASVFHFNGKEWFNIGAFGTKEWLQDIWGTSGTDVFVVGEFGSIRRYNGLQWTLNREPGAKGNAVTDLKFHRQNADIVYATTLDAGIYISPNQARKWLSLEAPEYSVFAISPGSLYAATQSGLWQCSGAGVIAGRLTDHVTRAGVHLATVFNDLGVKTLSVNGEYMMVTPVGNFSVTAIKDGYANQSIGNVTVYGGDVSWADFSMDVGVSDPTVIVSSGGGGDIGGGGCFICILTDGSR